MKLMLIVEVLGGYGAEGNTVRADTIMTHDTAEQALRNNAKDWFKEDATALMGAASFDDVRATVVGDDKHTVAHMYSEVDAMFVFELQEETQMVKMDFEGGFGVVSAEELNELHLDKWAHDDKKLAAHYGNGDSDFFIVQSFQKIKETLV